MMSLRMSVLSIEHIDIMDNQSLIEQIQYPMDMIIDKKMEDKDRCIRIDHIRIDLLNNLIGTFLYNDSSMGMIDIRISDNHFHLFDNPEDNCVNIQMISNREKSKLERENEQKIIEYSSFIHLHWIGILQTRLPHAASQHFNSPGQSLSN